MGAASTTPRRVRFTVPRLTKREKRARKENLERREREWRELEKRMDWSDLRSVHASFSAEKYVCWLKKTKLDKNKQKIVRFAAKRFRCLERLKQIDDEIARARARLHN